MAFQVYNRQLGQIELFTGDKSHGQAIVTSTRDLVEDPVFKELLGSPIIPDWSRK